MEASTTQPQEQEQRSSIKVTRNAKGDPQWEVKVVEGSTNESLDEIRRIAVNQYTALRVELA